MAISNSKKTIIFSLILLIIISNFLVYNSPLYDVLEIIENRQVVIGSLIDLLIVVPVLALILMKERTLKRLIMLVAAACIVATLSIPAHLLAPFKVITTTGLAVEAAIIIFEVSVIALFLFYLPKIRKSVRNANQPKIFAFQQAVQTYNKNKIVHILASELLIFYYAFLSWRKKADDGISMHKNSSYIAFQVMLIHAIILESLGLHWWLHSVAPVVSIILLILNAYGIVFLLADLQAMRLHPIKVSKEGMYITFGLMKRTYIRFDNIEEIITDPNFLQLKKQKDRIEFVCRDFEEVNPQLVFKMYKPQEVQFMYGIKKQYKYVALKCDDIAKLKGVIEKNYTHKEQAND